jgi:hypothetical protein
MGDKEQLITDLKQVIASSNNDTAGYEDMINILSDAVNNYKVDNKTFSTALEIIYKDNNMSKKLIGLITEIQQLFSKKVLTDKKNMSLEEIINIMIKIDAPFRIIYQKGLDLLLDTIRLMKEKQVELKNIIDKKEKEASIKRKSYLVMLDILTSNKDYIYASDITKIKISDEYTYHFFKVILNNNYKLYNELSSSNKLLPSITMDELEEMLLDNNFRINKDDKNKLYLYGNIDNIKGIVEEAKKNNFTFFNPSFPHFIDILISSSKDIFKAIGIALIDSKIDIDFFYNNPSIFVDKSVQINGLESKHDIFINNIALLKKKNINISNLSKYDSDILVSNPDKLFNQIALLNRYNIDFKKIFNIKYARDFEVLYNELSFDIADIYIESGLASYMMSHPYLLKGNMVNVVKRIVICREINMKIFDEEEKLLPSIMTGNDFIVSDDKLDDYLMENVEIDEKCSYVFNNHRRNYISHDVESFDIIKSLDDEYKVSDLEYNFDGMVISRIKVLRNMSVLLDIYGYDEELIKIFLVDSIIYKHYLSPDQMINIKDNLNEIVGSARIK